MSPQSRELGLNSQGQNVASLHSQLLNMGGSIDAAELALKIFGNTTRRRVLEFQQRTALPPTGVVDEDTASAIERAAEDVGGLEDEQKSAEVQINGIAAAADSSGPGGSEYERDLADLNASSGDRTLADLTSEDIVALGASSRVPHQRVEALAHAARLATPAAPNAVISSDPLPALPSAVWYAFTREGVGLTPEAFWARPLDELVGTVRAAADNGIVPGDLLDHMDDLRGVLEEQRADYLLDRPLRTATGREAEPTVRHILSAQPEHLTTAEQRVAATILFDLPHETDLSDLPDQLQQLGIARPAAESVTRACRLIDLTAGSVGLAQALQPLAGEGVSLAALATVAPDTLLDLAFQHGPLRSSTGTGTGTGTEEDGYARGLQARIENLHPSATLSARLQQGSIALRVPGADALVPFLRAHPDFDVMTSSIDDYLKQQPLDPEVDTASLSSGLRIIRRLRSLTSTWEQTAALANAGLRSAFEIAGTEPAELAEALGGQLDVDEATAIRVRAAAVQNATVGVMGLLPRFDATGVTAIAPADLGPDARLRHPTVAALFGSLDSCACGHCRSVLSPAAYFVDLLQLLRTESPQAFSVLTGRRPDLADVELSCQNSNQELPAVDLALEVLENTVALPLMLPLAPGTDLGAELASGRIPDTITEQLKRTALDLGPGLVASRDPGELAPPGYQAWTVSGSTRRWALHHSVGSIHVIPPWRVPGGPTPLTGLDLATTVTELDQGRLPANLDTRLRAAVTTDPLTRAAMDMVSVQQSTPGTRWTVSYMVEVVVVGTLGTAGEGRISLATPSGTTLLEKTYSAPSVTATLDALAEGRVGGMLPTMLRAPGMFTAVAPAGGGGANLRRMIRLDVVYTPAELRVVGLAYQSSPPEAQLRAFPRNRNPSAYEHLARAKFPWSLPFDLPLAETRELLARARYPRRDLLELLRPESRLHATVIAEERLGLTPVETELITGPAATGEQLWSAWGLRRDGTDWVVSDASTSERVSSADPIALLERVSLLLQQAGLTYPQLLDLLATRFVRGDEPALSTMPPTECRPSLMRLRPLTPQLLDRLHRFVRLSRATGWGIPDLDVALHGLLQDGAITAQTLVALSHLTRVRELTSQGVDQITGWWSGIGTQPVVRHTDGATSTTPAQFDRLFRDPSVRSEPDAAFTLNASRTALAHERALPSSWPTLAQKLPDIAATLGTRASELAMFAAALPMRPPGQPATGGAPGPGETQPLQLTLDTLSRLHRAVALGAALGLTAADYVTAVRVTGIEPFPLPAVVTAPAARTRATVEFIEAVRLITGTGFTIPEMAYLLRHDATPVGDVTLTDTTVASTLMALGSRVSEVQKPGTGPATNPPSEAALRVEATAAAIAVLAPAVGLDQDTIRDLLTTGLTVPGGQKPAIEALLDDDLIGASEQTLTAHAFPAAFALVRRLRKIGLLAGRLGLGGTQLGWLATTGGSGQPGSPGRPGLRALDLDAIPAGHPSGESPLPFISFRRVVALARLHARSPSMDEVLGRYVTRVLGPRFEQAHLQDGIAAAAQLLSAALDLPADQVRAAAAHVFGQASSLQDTIALSGLFDVLAVLSRLGINMEQLLRLGGDASTDTAQLARAMLRSRYPDGQWPDVIRPVSDALRVRQRDALVDFLVHRDDLASADELYERYLIDVLTAPVVTSTRLLAATAAVQLFVHRCLVGLEKMPVSTTVRQRWEYMRIYRVWQANREVFVRPQNYLHPELREDASEAFRAVESALTQDEPSFETARTALLGYLDDLVELDRLFIVGMYQHMRTVAGTERSDLYLVGRTADPPSRYFWRVCEDFTGPLMRWRPWERVEVDISGTHVTPFILAGELHLAWLVSRKDQSAPRGNWEIQLAWARRTSRGWTRKYLSRDTARHPAAVNKDERRTFTLQLDPQILPPPPSTSGIPLASSLGEQAMVIECHAAIDDSVILPRGGDIARSGQSTEPLTLRLRVRVLLRKPAQGFYWPASKAPLELQLDQGPIGVTKISLATDDKGCVSTPVTPGSFPLGSSSLFTPEQRSGFRLAHFAIGWLTLIARDGVTNVQQERVYPQTTETLNSQREWDVEFVFDVPENTKVPDGRDDSDRVLRWALLGSFTVYSHKEATWTYGYGHGRWVSSGGDPYENGLLERPANVGGIHLGGDFGNGPRYQLIGESPGRSVVVPASPVGTGTWYYRDDAGRYLVSMLPAGRSLFLTDGQPLAARFLADARGDLGALFNPVTEALTDGGKVLDDVNKPAPAPASGSVKRQGVVFDGASPYAGYSAELFLHLPILIAEQLSRQRRFADAEQWLRLVFDPTSDDTRTSATPDPSLFWRYLPFRQQGRPERIEDLLTWLADPSTPDARNTNVRLQIAHWLDNPFRPHEIARLRPGAYQWQVVFTYLNNLLDWGDERFRRDTRESIVEATMLYVQAATILGPRPRTTQPGLQPPPLSYRDLHGRWDEFSNAWYSLADSPLVRDLARAWVASPTVPAQPGTGGPLRLPTGGEAVAMLLSTGLTYFCVPPNDKLLDYWDRVADRLFKIRHSQNIDGAQRELAFYEPRMDPDALVRAVAAGVDIGSALAGRDKPLSQYRYSVLAQRAAELCAELKGLGAAVLAAREKQDAEALARLRAGQESSLLELVKQVRMQQVNEAQANIDALGASREIAASRYRHLQYLLTGAPVKEPPAGTPVSEATAALPFAPSDALAADSQGLGLLHAEAEQLRLIAEATQNQVGAGIANYLAGVFHAGGASETVTKVGVSLGHAASAAAAIFHMGSELASSEAHRRSVLSGHQRRRDEWTTQSNAALREMAQIDKQIAAAGLRLAIAKQELDNHDQQILNARAVDEFLHEKHTNTELYTWMGDQLGSVYYSAYTLALDLAKQAEQALQFELHQPDTSYIKPRSWDSQRKGLLAGERLANDLKRLEVAYLEGNRREHEMTRHVSLRQLSPAALLAFRATGGCIFSLPETLFDLDSPGHFLRRLKTVSLSLPCVAGPYAGVHPKLTLLSSQVRHTPQAPTRPEDYPRGTDDNRFTDDTGGLESIVASGAVDASGVWEMNLRDERRLPFEGRGAISTWQLELPDDFRQFDYASITDVVIHVRYSARAGSDALRTAATAALPGAAARGDLPQVVLLSAKYDFATAWAKFRSSTAGAGTPASGTIPAAPRAALVLELRREHYPYLAGPGPITLTSVTLAGSPTPATPADIVVADRALDVANPADDTAKTRAVMLTRDKDTAPFLQGTLGTDLPSAGARGARRPWKPPPEPIGHLPLHLDSTELDDLFVLLAWTRKVTPP